MKPTIDALAMSPEQQAIALQYMKESANGGTPSPELVSRMNSLDLIQKTERFRAQCIVARHNQDENDRVTEMKRSLAAWGEPESYVPAYMLTPKLWRVDQQPDGFGGSYWTWAVDNHGAA